jgi:hypothetical protein
MLLLVITKALSIVDEIWRGGIYPKAKKSLSEYKDSFIESAYLSFNLPEGRDGFMI